MLLGFETLLASFHLEVELMENLDEPCSQIVHVNDDKYCEYLHYACHTVLTRKHGRQGDKEDE
jgi:hypothetical protein